MARKITPPPPAPPSMPLGKGRDMLAELLERGKAMLGTGTVSQAGLTTWKNQVREILERMFGSDSDYVYSFAGAGIKGIVISDYDSDDDGGRDRIEEISAKIEMLSTTLEAVAFELKHEAQKPSGTPVAFESRATSVSQAVFIVHGHEEAGKVEVARLLERLGLEPIILHEQANAGQTLIEKFEVNAAQASFAVILLTPDDVGGLRSGAAHPRARQNVILEMGYFAGKLGRARVCPLYVEGVELPSDLLGIAYTKRDDGGAWKLALAKELKAAGFQIDFNKLF